MTTFGKRKDGRFYQKGKGITQLTGIKLTPDDKIFIAKSKRLTPKEKIEAKKIFNDYTVVRGDKEYRPTKLSLAKEHKKQLLEAELEAKGGYARIVDNELRRVPMHIKSHSAFLYPENIGKPICHNCQCWKNYAGHLSGCKCNCHNKPDAWARR